MCTAWSRFLSPPRLSRWRTVWPLLALSGLVPARAANAASLHAKIVGTPIDGVDGLLNQMTKAALLTFLWVDFHDRPRSGGQSPPRMRSAMAISASGLW